ncbi:MAG TPA: DUF3422 domain-containing protein [Phenylobacterium sp.]
MTIEIPADHPLRRALIDEMHIRRLPAFQAPCLLAQLVVQSGEDGAEADRLHAEAICARLGVSTPAPGRYICVRAGEVWFVWERHTECSTYAFIREGAFARPFAFEHLAQAPAELLRDIPGEVVRATQIAVLGPEAPEPTAEALAESFSTGELVACDLEGGARIWSDFKLHGDRFGRLLIHDRGLVGGELARLVQRLQELGNYRNMALLGLPVAQALTPKVTALETELARLAGAIASGEAEDEAMLHDLAGLSAQLATLTSETRYRMAATQAYATLSIERLRSLSVGRVAGFETLGDFNERRLAPAMRTCESFSRRLEDLSQRAAWTSSMLRTRIDTAMERQSRDLLASMNRRTDLQLRLQQTVEGLSVVAVSYYVLGLAGYLLKPFTHADPDLHALLIAGATPVVLALAWIGLRRIRRSIEEPRREA